MPIRRGLAAGLVPLAAGVLAGSCRPSTPPTVVANDLRAAAGVARGDSLTVALEAGLARWFPGAEPGPSLDLPAFAEVGKAPAIPGPLLRVRAGVLVAVSIRNRLPDTLLVIGLAGPDSRDTLVVPPAATGASRFRASRAGLYGYIGSTRRGAVTEHRGRGEQLYGVLAVDSVGAPADRILAIGAWNGPPVPAVGDSSFLLTVNGKYWPHTERFRLTVGDTARWRVINFANSIHPMHLHGAYFRVDARGTWRGDTAAAPGDRRMVVTETIRWEESMTMTWAPSRPGRWLLHCHDVFHMASRQESDLRLVAPLWARQIGSGDTTSARARPAGHHDQHEMAGLVVGVEVAGEDSTPSAPVARRVALTIQERARVFRDSAGIGFVLARPGSVPADSIEIPGPPLILTRGELAEVTVHNRLAEPASVHWHGVELESYYDGVGGWSGVGARVAPSIAPGDSFVARFAPPRAGTFIYHSHFDEVRQLSLGLFGPLLVVEPGRDYDPGRDRVLLFAVAGTGDSALVVLHRRPEPLAAGVEHRLRFINITAGDDIAVELLQGGRPVRWRRLAKDGADLPSAQAVIVPARLRFAPGETADVAFTPGRGPVTVRVKSFNDFDAVLPVR